LVTLVVRLETVLVGEAWDKPVVAGVVEVATEAIEIVVSERGLAVVALVEEVGEGIVVAVAFIVGEMGIAVG